MWFETPSKILFLLLINMIVSVFFFFFKILSASKLPSPCEWRHRNISESIQIIQKIINSAHIWHSQKSTFLHYHLVLYPIVWALLRIGDIFVTGIGEGRGEILIDLFHVCCSLVSLLYIIRFYLQGKFNEIRLTWRHIHECMRSQPHYFSFKGSLL